MPGIGLEDTEMKKNKTKQKTDLLSLVLLWLDFKLC